MRRSTSRSSTTKAAQPEVRPLGPLTGLALSVDVEEWYHSCWVPEYVDPARRPPLVEELDRLLPALIELLADLGSTATFFVLGEVNKPGTFPLDKETTVLEAVTLAGGYSATAAASGVKVLRRNVEGKQETIALDLSGAVPRDKSFRLQEGDTVLVPKGNTFFVFGEVKKPGAYQLDKETNVLEGITIAGGFTDKAAPGRTRVIRTDERGQQTINIDMNDVIRRGQREKAIRLLENDVIVVPESFF